MPTGSFTRRHLFRIAPSLVVVVDCELPCGKVFYRDPCLWEVDKGKYSIHIDPWSKELMALAQILGWERVIMCRQVPVVPPNKYYEGDGVLGACFVGCLGCLRRQGDH